MSTTCRTVLFLLLAFNASLSFAQTGSITGMVQTRVGDGIPGANISLQGMNRGTVTNENGHFQLEGLKEGTYALVISSIGFHTMQQSVTVMPGRSTAIKLELAEAIYQLDEVTITNQRSLNEQSALIGKAGIKLFDLPQSMMTLSRDVLDQQQTVRLSDAIKNVNGLYVMGTTGGYQEELAGRGFAYNSSNTFKNGARFNNGILPEMSSLERVEVMKGSTAILFGNVAAGGIVNLVTKKPKFERGGEVSMKVGSFGFYKPSLDIHGPLDEKNRMAFRINTAHENAGSFRDGVSSKRFYFNPSLLIKAGQKTDVLLEGDYLDDHRTLDYGIGAINYQIPAVPRNRFIGASWSYYDGVQKSLTLTVTHKLNQRWKLTGVAAGQDFRTDLFGTTRPNANSQFVKADGKWIRGLQRSQVKENYWMAQVDLTGTMQVVGTEHTVLVGADVDGYNTNTTAFFNLAQYDSINLFNLELYKQRSDIPSLNKRTFTRNPVRRVGIYAQDLIAITPKLKALAGLRYSYLDRQNNVYTFPTATAPESQTVTNNYDGAFTPRFGLVFQPTTITSLFASYANSFNLNSGIDINSKPLAPSFVDQYELGIKNEILKGFLSANVTLYQIVNSNFAQAVIVPSGNPNNIPANAQELAGEVTSKGIEVDLVSRSYRGLSVIAGYSFNETRYTKSNIYEVGSRLRYNPQHTANMSLYYNFPEQSLLKKFNIGTTLFYVGDRVAGRSTRLTVNNDSFRLMPLPDYLLLDASVGYITGRFTMRLRVNNLTNQLSFNVHDDNSVNPIAPRTVTASLAIKL